MQKTQGSKVITCILKKGKAIALMEALNEKGIIKINFAFARGSDLNDPKSSSGKLKETEKEIVTVVADSPEQAEELFDFIYEKAALDHPGAGLIYMASLNYTTPYAVMHE